MTLGVKTCPVLKRDLYLGEFGEVINIHISWKCKLKKRLAKTRVLNYGGPNRILQLGIRPPGEYIN